jgi:acetate kinase
LTLNSGSSSLKFSIFEFEAGAEKLLLHGKLDRIGSGEGHFEMMDGNGKKLADDAVALRDHHAALDLLLGRISALETGVIGAIGHRIVQGGPHHLGPEIVTPGLLKELHRLCPLDPPHLPAALQALEAAGKLGTDIPQVACFDTSFHRTLPAVAQALPLPRALTQETGLMRYGFHGLSYEYVATELERIAGAATAGGKVIIAHLGNGASMAALLNGKSVETTMGFTPAGGLMMGSRPGDLDPGILAYLIREKKVAPEKLNDFIYQQCGLQGVSGLSSDLRDLHRAQASDPRAREAIELFGYLARKALGGLVAVLDGLETLVFTGGIGENDPPVRASLCGGLHHLGLRLDRDLNEKSQPVISSSDSRVTVRVMATNEELVIARHTARLAFCPSQPSPETSP